MPLKTKPEDKPAAICFHLDFQGRDSQDQGPLEVTATLLPNQLQHPYRIDGGAPHFHDRDDFKARAVRIGMTPAVAEDPGRSFNATARQLRELGFTVELEEEQPQKQAA
jgi:hypothetical protein